MDGDARVPRVLRSTAWWIVAASALLLAACGDAQEREPRRAPSARPVPSSQPVPSAPAIQADQTGPDDTDDESADRALTQAAWARLRWPGGGVVASHRLDRLDEPVHAGSLFKLVTARAALAQGVITTRTAMACPRRVEVHGRRLDCVHPDLGRPLTVEDAIAYSCNHFFVRLAERLDRRVLASMLQRLSSGAIRLDGDALLPLVVVGLEGPRAGMRTWARTVLAATTVDDGDGGAAVARRGMRRAVEEGTARQVHDRETVTFAKTSTTMPDAGGQEGRVVAWRPDDGEIVVVRAAGVAGRDAAGIARAVWRAARRDTLGVRVGQWREPPAGDVRVERVALEPYVAAVVAGEGGADMPPAALDALAVVARTYAVASPGRHAADGYDVCDTTHCQVRGVATEWSRRAAARTSGLVLARDGEPLAVPYSASCGGVLACMHDIWSGDDPAVTRTGPDPAAHPVATWHSEIREPALRGALRDAGVRGDLLLDLRVLARTPGGVPKRLALDGLTPSVVDATRFRHVVGRRLGWDVLKSHVWDVRRSSGGFRFEGRGKGHGAGLCVLGATTLADRGWPLDRILKTYAPGVSLQSLHDRVRVQVPSSLASDAPRLRREVRATLADLRGRLSVETPRDVEVVVHPTRPAYQRATGRAWWTAGSSRALGAGRHRIDLAPDTADALGVTIRHEVVHVLTAPALAGAPAWTVEGLAYLLARPDAPRTTGPCPSDAEIGRPGTLEAMRDVYARAAGCVQARVGDEAGWRQLAGQ